MTYQKMTDELLKMKAAKDCRREAWSPGRRRFSDRGRRQGAGDRVLYVEEADDGYGAEEISSFLDYESCRDKLTFRLVNYGMLQNCLANRIHRRVMDLAAVYYYNLGSIDGEPHCVAVKKGDLERWGITEEELHRDAVLNASRTEPPVFLTVDKMVEHLFYPEILDGHSGICTIVDPEEVELSAREGIAAWHLEENWSKDELPDLFVLTNKSQLYGASAMLYSGLLRSIAEHFQNDLTIIPSSVHEVLILPSACIPSDEELVVMIREVNECCLRRNEILSDRPYHYSREHGTLR